MRNTPSKKRGFDPAKKAGNVQSVGTTVDDTEAKRTGPWRKSTRRSNHIGAHYLATDKGKGPYAITWQAKLPKPGTYEVRVSFGGGEGLARDVPYRVRHAEGETHLTIDQKPGADHTRALVSPWAFHLRFKRR